MSATVLQLSDIHFAGQPAELVHGLDPDARLARVLDAWRALHIDVDLVVLTGDIAEDASHTALERVAAAVAPLAAPVLAVAGNHDDARAVVDVFGPPCAVDVGGWRIVGIDTTRPGDAHGTIDVDATAAALDEAPDVVTMLAIHHPPVSRSTLAMFRLDGGERLLDALADRPHVKAVLSGHLHDDFSFEGRGGVALLGCPSTYGALTHDGDTYEIHPDAPIGARILHLDDDGTFATTVLVVDPVG
jgi:Icc protein